MDLQRTYARRLIDDAGERAGLDGAGDGLHQRMHAEAQAEVEHDGAVFDQEIGVAGPAIDDVRPSAGALSGSDNAVVDPPFRVPREGRNRLERSDLRVLRRQAPSGLRGGKPNKADFVARPKLPHLPQLDLGDSRRASKPPNDGPSGPRITGISPVKFTVPTA